MNITDDWNCQYETLGIFLIIGAITYPSFSIRVGWIIKTKYSRIQGLTLPYQFSDILIEKNDCCILVYSMRLHLFPSSERQNKNRVPYHGNFRVEPTNMVTLKTYFVVYLVSI